MRRLILAGFLTFATGCNPKSSSSNPPADTPSSTPVSSEESDRKMIDKLEADAKALAKVDGCSASADCRAVPIGVRGCGGPRDFIIYCAKATDSLALHARITAADSAEMAYNTKYKIVSTCELRLPPVAVLSEGSCVASVQ
jgi:hypothetical protein